MLAWNASLGRSCCGLVFVGCHPRPPPSRTSSWSARCSPRHVLLAALSKCCCGDGCRASHSSGADGGHGGRGADGCHAEARAGRRRVRVIVWSTAAAPWSRAVRRAGSCAAGTKSGFVCGMPASSRASSVNVKTAYRTPQRAPYRPQAAPCTLRTPPGRFRTLCSQRGQT